METQILAAISHIKNISKKRPTNERILSYLNKKEQQAGMKRLKEVLCSLCAKNLLNSNDIAESEENGIPNLPTVDVVHIKPVELDFRPSNLNSNKHRRESYQSYQSSSHTSQNWISFFFLSLYSNPG